MCGSFGRDIPGEQILDAVDGMIRDARQYGAQVAFWVESISFAVPIKLYIAAVLSPPASEPAKGKFLPSATTRNALSAALLSIFNLIIAVTQQRVPRASSNPNHSHECKEVTHRVASCCLLVGDTRGLPNYA